ncbi:Glutathione S-transferase, N-terminal domain subfamily [gamma proteobacterium HTCC5015]|nr:Glutathione S-transferase, N-terminal domain subfamily [gamma proteobacterium HTCC5015]
MFFRSTPTATPPENPEQAQAQLADLKLYYFSSCPFCQRVLRHLQALELEVELCDISASTAHRNALQQGGGRTTVPCLYIGKEERWLYESKDIITFIDQRIAETN